MIKKLSFKFVLVFLVLVVSVIITSSCYAAEEYTFKDFNITLDKDAKTITALHVPSNMSQTYDISYGLDNYSDYYLQVNDFNKYSNMFSINYAFGLVFSNELDWKEYSNESLYAYCDQNQYVYFFQFIQWASNGNYVFQSPYSNVGFSDSENGSSYYKRGQYLLSLDYDYNYKYLDTEILTASHIITTPNGTVLYSSQSVNVTHEFQSDTSAKVNFDYSLYGTDYILKYSLTGVELNADLTAPLELKNPITYTPRSNKFSC